jgi:hypothetical protein
MKSCIICKEQIHPKRLEILPNATKCVKCSTTGKKGGVTVTKGEGDHTYNETIIMEPDEYLKYQEIEAKLSGKPFDDAIINDEGNEDNEEGESETELPLI